MSERSFNDEVVDEFRRNGGTVETMGFGRRLVLVHHVGARSGTERVAPLAALRTDQGSWLVAASAAGSHSHPAWYRNLLAHPETTIETPDEGEVPVRVVELQGAVRDAAWTRFTENPGFSAYEEKTSRVIPVLELHRR